MADTMQFDLVSPERSLVSVAAREVRLPGTDGDLTAMPGHAPAIVTLRPGMALTLMNANGIGRVLTAILVVGLAGFWAFAELSRWGPGVLAAGGLTVIVMIERMDQIWQ